MTQDRLLRRRFHAHLSRSGISRRRLSGVLRATRDGGGSGAVYGGGQQRVAHSRPGAGRGLQRADLHRLHGAHHPADGRRRSDGRDVRGGDLRGVGGVPALPSLRGRAGGIGGAGRTGPPAGADLELASMPRIVSGTFRARWSDRRRDLLVAARLHEAASEHLRGGAQAGWRASRPRP